MVPHCSLTHCGAEGGGSSAAVVVDNGSIDGAVVALVVQCVGFRVGYNLSLLWDADSGTGAVQEERI